MRKADIIFPEQGIVREVVAEAVRLGAESVEVECKDRCEQVFALPGGVGVGIERL